MLKVSHEGSHEKNEKCWSPMSNKDNVKINYISEKVWSHAISLFW